jgi:hypothetical protein
MTVETISEQHRMSVRHGESEMKGRQSRAGSLHCSNESADGNKDTEGRHDR